MEQGWRTGLSASLMVIAIGGCSAPAPSTTVHFVLPNGFTGPILVPAAKTPQNVSFGSDATLNVDQDGIIRTPGAYLLYKEGFRMGDVRFADGKPLKRSTQDPSLPPGEIAWRSPELVSAEGDWEFVGTRSDWTAFMAAPPALRKSKTQAR